MAKDSEEQQTPLGVNISATGKSKVVGVTTNNAPANITASDGSEVKDIKASGQPKPPTPAKRKIWLAVVGMLTAIAYAIGHYFKSQGH